MRRSEVRTSASSSTVNTVWRETFRGSHLRQSLRETARAADQIPQHLISALVTLFHPLGHGAQDHPLNQSRKRCAGPLSGGIERLWAAQDLASVLPSKGTAPLSISNSTQQGSTNRCEV